jgi:hypothetical protein
LMAWEKTGSGAGASGVLISVMPLMFFVLRFAGEGFLVRREKDVSYNTGEREKCGFFSLFQEHEIINPN